MGVHTDTAHSPRRGNVIRRWVNRVVRSLNPIQNTTLKPRGLSFPLMGPSQTRPRSGSNVPSCALAGEYSPLICAKPAYRVGNRVARREPPGESSCRNKAGNSASSANAVKSPLLPAILTGISAAWRTSLRRPCPDRNRADGGYFETVWRSFRYYCALIGSGVADFVEGVSRWMNTCPASGCLAEGRRRDFPTMDFSRT